MYEYSGDLTGVQGRHNISGHLYQTVPCIDCVLYKLLTVSTTEWHRENVSNPLPYLIVKTFQKTPYAHTFPQGLTSLPCPTMPPEKVSVAAQMCDTALEDEWCK